MYGLIDSNNNDFVQFVPENDLYKYLEPKYNFISMNEKQANIISQSCMVKKWDEPETVNATLVNGKIHTHGRILGDSILVEMSENNFRTYLKSGDIVPAKYYKILEQPESLKLPANLPEDMVKVWANPGDIKVMSQIRDTIAAELLLKYSTSMIDIDIIAKFCETFGESNVISWVKKYKLSFDGIAKYALNKNDVDLYEYTLEMGGNYYDFGECGAEILDLHIGYNSLDADLVVKMAKERGRIKYLIDNHSADLVSANALSEVSESYPKLSEFKLLYTFYEEHKQLPTDLMHNVAQCDNVELARYLHSQQYVYNIPEVFNILTDYFNNDNKHRLVLEHMVDQWSKTQLWDQLNIYTKNNLEKGQSKTHETGPNINPRYYSKIRYLSVILQKYFEGDKQWYRQLEDYSNDELISMVKNNNSEKNKCFKILINRGVYDFEPAVEINRDQDTMPSIWSYLIHKQKFNPYEL